MHSHHAAGNGFVNTQTLPTVGQTIIVEKQDGGEIVHLYGTVREVVPEEGRISLEHPEGVDRFLWFPEPSAGWREAVDPDLRLMMLGLV